MRKLPDSIDQIKALQADLREIKERQFSGASNVIFIENQTEDVYDVDTGLNANWEWRGWVDFVADTMDFPFARLSHKIWINGTPHILGDGDIIGFRGAPFKVYATRLVGGGVTEKKGVRFQIRIKNISGAGITLKMKFKVVATDSGVLYPSGITGFALY